MRDKKPEIWTKSVSGEDYRWGRSGVGKDGDQRRKMKTNWKDPSVGASAPTSQDDLSAGQNGAGSCIKQQLFCPTAGVAARWPPFSAHSSRSKWADASSKAWLSKWGTNRLCGKLMSPFCHKKGKEKRNIFIHIYVLVCKFLILCCHLVVENKNSFMLQFSSVSRI